MFLNKGEVVEVNLGNPPGEIKGHEQAFVRPCIVIKAFNNLQLAIVIPLTTKEPKYAYYTIVKLSKGTAGFRSDSFALCHQIRSVSFDRISQKRSRLEQKDILKIHSVLMDTLEI